VNWLAKARPRGAAMTLTWKIYQGNRRVSLSGKVDLEPSISLVEDYFNKLGSKRIEELGQEKCL